MSFVNWEGKFEEWISVFFGECVVPEETLFVWWSILGREGVFLFFLGGRTVYSGVFVVRFG